MLAATFRALAPANAASELADAELDATLSGYLAAARTAWPSLQIPDAAFVCFLAERSSEGRLPELACAPDLWLACACSQGQPEARELFHAAYDPLVTRVLGRRGASPSELQDAKQALFEKLLVADAAGRAKIADYKGHGPLKSWVASVAATTLLMMQRATARRRERSEDDAVVEQAIDDGPELRYLKQRYKAQVEAAIVHALSQLADRERVLLRLHLCERMSIDRLGVMYGVNRATAARWLASARNALLQRSREEIRRSLALSQSECDSILNLVNSQLDVSVARHLGA